jgi:hypothetical protein
MDSVLDVARKRGRELWLSTGFSADPFTGWRNWFRNGDPAYLQDLRWASWEGHKHIQHCAFSQSKQDILIVFQWTEKLNYIFFTYMS